MNQGVKNKFFPHFTICLLLFLPIFFNLFLPGGKLALITEAWAAERLTMAVVDVTQKEVLPPASWPEIYQILLKELSKEEGFSVMKPEEIAYVLDAHPVYSEAAYQFETAGKLLMEARDLYKDSKFDKASEKLKMAKSIFLYNLESAEDLSVLIDIYRYLAISYLGLEDVESGVAEFKEGLAIFPQMSLPEGELPPLVVDGFSRAKGELREAPKAKLNIQSNPSSALVYLDGSQIGLSPASVEEVPLGTHLLWVEKIGYLTHAEKLVLDTEQTFDQKIELVYKKELKMLDRLREEVNEKGAVIKRMTPYALRIGVSLWADFLLVVSLREPSDNEHTLDTYLFNIKNYRYLSSKSTKFIPTKEEAEGKIKELAQSIIQEPETGRMTEEVRVKKGKGIKAYLWAAGGSAILAGSLGTRLKASKDADEYDSLLNQHDNYIRSYSLLDQSRIDDYKSKMGEARDSYDTFNTISYVTLGVGLACLGVASYYYIESYEKDYFDFEPLSDEDVKKLSFEPIIYAGHNSFMLSMNCRF